MTNKDIIKEEKLNLLRLELSNLTTKINSTVDSIWKIRTAAFILWGAAIGYGLDPIKSRNPPLVSMLFITILIPLWFYWIDAKYNQWYRMLSSRERHIQEFLNSEKFDEELRTEGFTFSVYDISGEKSLGDKPKYKWHTSLLRSWIDTTPMFIYGGQMLVSASLCTVYGSIKFLKREWIYILIPAVIVFYVVLYSVGI